MATGGLVLLADLSASELETVYTPERFTRRSAQRPDMDRLRRELAKVRRNGFAVNEGRSERGVVAIGCPVRDTAGTAVAGLSVSMPSVRYSPARLPELVQTIRSCVQTLERDLHA